MNSGYDSDKGIGVRLLVGLLEVLVWLMCNWEQTCVDINDLRKYPVIMQEKYKKNMKKTLRGSKG